MFRKNNLRALVVASLAFVALVPIHRAAGQHHTAGAHREPIAIGPDDWNFGDPGTVPVEPRRERGGMVDQPQVVPSSCFAGVRHYPAGALAEAIDGGGE